MLKSFGPNFSSIWIVLKLWLLLMAAFSLGRIFYLVDYFFILKQDSYTWSGILGAMISALRFDSSVSSFLILPLLLMALAIGKQFSRPWVVRVWKAYGVIVAAVCWLTIVGDHYFFVYFKDHFNVFFWESFENWSNFQLAFGGVGDEVPLATALTILIGSIGAWSLLIYQSNPVDHGPGIYQNWARKHPRILALVIFFGFLMAARGTFNSVPLLKQDARKAISSNRMVTLLHTNPFLPLYRGLRDYRDLQSGRRHNKNAPLMGQAEFEAAQLFVPNSKIVGTGRSMHFEQTVVPRAILKRKPKHIVLFFMESLSSWPTDFEDEEFAERVAPNFRRLREQGWYFPHHFPPGAGTMKNIIAAIYSVPIPREFFPSLNYHPWAYKDYPQLIHKVLKTEGYASRFYYAGFGAWHRLYSFIPAIGFEKFLSEGQFPDLPHQKYGLFDGDFFDGIHEKLAAETEPSFNFVMSLSNHPPYTVPDSFNDTTWPIPPQFEDRLIAGKEKFYDRFNAYRYSDASLGEYFKKARKSEYFKDTLYIITADHPFGGALAYPQALGWKEEYIPLLFYAPDLMEPEYVGKKTTTASTHLDLTPTILSMVSEEPRTIVTWGKNLIDAPLEPYQNINKYFSCIQTVCLKRGQYYDVGEDLIFTPRQEDWKTSKEFRVREKSYYQSGLQFLSNF